MKIKNIVTSVIAGASLLAFVGAASAATTYKTGTGTPTAPGADMNIYGASAEFTFFKSEIPHYLTAAGCTLGASATSSDGKHFVQQASCGGTTVNWRVSSKASYDGPLAVDSNSTNPSRDASCDASGLNYRNMLHVDGTLSCEPVTIGASDVQVGDFMQKSSGLLLGPLGGAQTTRNFVTSPFTLSANTSAYCRPLAVPFAFFANNSVKLADGTTTVSNLSTAEAKMIFQGLIKNWADLQATPMASKVINVCYRHAGSGTHATLDAFMRPSTMLQNAVTGGTSAHYYFNDGSSDLMRCVNGSGTWTGDGAIGYADADQSLSSFPNTVRLTLDGNLPTTDKVDDFTWSFATIQNLYANTTVGATDIMQDLCTYASQPSTITTVNPNWSASCNMKHIKNSNFGNFITNTNYHNSNCN